LCPADNRFPGFWGPKIKKFNPQTKIFLFVLDKRIAKVISMKSSLLLTLFVLLVSFQPKPNDAPSDIVCLSREELKLYHLIMDYRKTRKLESIPISAKLSRVAKAHTSDLMANYSFDLKNPCNPHSWSDKGSWTACCYTSDHKAASCMWQKPREIAQYESPGYEIAYYSSAGASAQEGLQGWKVSPGHNPLIINSGMWSEVKWKAIGISIYGSYGIVWFGETEDPSQLVECN
jgi:uncharacterized protein YkwD